jgi:hypothetical protein
MISTRLISGRTAMSEPGGCPPWLRLNKLDAPPLHPRPWYRRAWAALTLADAGKTQAEVDGCAHLHDIANRERDLYGKVVSLYVGDHVDNCGKDMVTIEYH